MIYLGLAVWGAVHPGLWYLSFFRENGWSLGGVIASWHVNAGATGLVWDMTIAAVALTVWVLAEVWVRRNWWALVAVPVTFGIGLSCGLPLYLFLRTRPVA